MQSLIRSAEPPAEGPLALLGACHARIREHLRMARVLVQASGAEPESAIAATAGAVDRYFRTALPLHIEDEEKSVAPRLSTAQDGALARMRGEHRAHELRCAALLALTEAIEREPHRLREVRAALAEVVPSLCTELEAHLVHEEEALFPAIAALSAHDARAIVAEIRARRG